MVYLDKVYCIGLLFWIYLLGGQELCCYLPGAEGIVYLLRAIGKVYRADLLNTCLKDRSCAAICQGLME
jgi:hypothetical protein